MTSDSLDLRTALLPRLLSGRPLLWRVAVVLAGSWVIAAASRAAIPMYPVPMTLQTFALFVIAGLCGPRLTAEIVVVWLLQALIGLPVLAEGDGGLYTFIGPTGGFLVGMLAAGPFAGYLSQRWTGVVRLSGVFLLGHALVLLLGWAWLAASLDPRSAFTGGVQPFLLGAVVKSIAAALIVALAQTRPKAI